MPGLYQALLPAGRGPLLAPLRSRPGSAFRYPLRFRGSAAVQPVPSPCQDASGVLPLDPFPIPALGAQGIPAGGREDRRAEPQVCVWVCGGKGPGRWAWDPPRGVPGRGGASQAEPALGEGAGRPNPGRPAGTAGSGAGARHGCFGAAGRILARPASVCGRCGSARATLKLPDMGRVLRS